MKFQNILLLLTACLLAGSCSDDDNDGAWFLPRTLQVMDAKTDAPRANEPLTLNFIGDDGELYSHRHTTDENGCIHFKGSTRGGIPRCVQLLPRYGQRLFPFVPPGFRR